MISEGVANPLKILQDYRRWRNLTWFVQFSISEIELDIYNPPANEQNVK